MSPIVAGGEEHDPEDPWLAFLAAWRRLFSKVSGIDEALGEGVARSVFEALECKAPRDWPSEGAWARDVQRMLLKVVADQMREAVATRRRADRDIHPISLQDPGQPQGGEDVDLPRLQDALDALARDYPRAAEVVRLRYVLGMPSLEVAKILGVSDSTVEKDWAFARAWLRRALDRAE